LRPPTGRDEPRDTLADVQRDLERIERDGQREVPQVGGPQAVGPRFETGSMVCDHGGHHEAAACDQEGDGGVVDDADHGSNPNARIVAEETANWKIDEAYVVTERMFKQHPRIGALFCSNDMMAIGAMKYLQESGRSQVLVAGFDALDEARIAIRAKQLAVTVDQQAAEQGYLGVTTALALLHDKPVPLDILVDTRLVTSKTVE